MSVLGGVLLLEWTVDSRASLSSIGRAASPSASFDTFLLPNFPVPTYTQAIQHRRPSTMGFTGSVTPGARKTTPPSVLGVTVFVNCSCCSTLAWGPALTWDMQVQEIRKQGAGGRCKCWLDRG